MFTHLLVNGLRHDIWQRFNIVHVPSLVVWTKPIALRTTSHLSFNEMEQTALARANNHSFFTRCLHSAEYVFRLHSLDFNLQIDKIANK